MNARQKKKQAYKVIKHQILHMEPGDILMLKPDFDEIDLDFIIRYLQVVVKTVLPKKCAAAIMPCMDVEVMPSDVAEVFAVKLLETIRELRDEQ